MDGAWRPRVHGATGRWWRVDQPQGSSGFDVQGRGRFWIGWPEDEPATKVWVQHVMGETDTTLDDQLHLRTAWQRAQIPEIAESPYIRRVLDFADAFDLYLFHELATGSLDETLKAGDVEAGDVEAVEHNVRAALETLHDLGYVHSDVREDNVLQVDGVWKLSDLGGSVRVGEEVRWFQRDLQYRHPSIEEGTRAETTFDWYAFSAMVDNLA